MLPDASSLQSQSPGLNWSSWASLTTSSRAAWTRSGGCYHVLMESLSGRSWHCKHDPPNLQIMYWDPPPHKLKITQGICWLGTSMRLVAVTRGSRRFSIASRVKVCVKDLGCVKVAIQQPPENMFPTILIHFIPSALPGVLQYFWFSFNFWNMATTTVEFECFVLRHA